MFLYTAVLLFLHIFSIVHSLPKGKKHVLNELPIRDPIPYPGLVSRVPNEGNEENNQLQDGTEEQVGVPLSGGVAREGDNADGSEETPPHNDGFNGAGAMIDGDGSQETPPHNDGFNGAGAMIDGDGSQETPPHNDGFNGAGAMIDGDGSKETPPHNDGFNGAGAMIDGDGSQETPPHNDGFNGAGAMIDGDGSQETPPHNDGFNGAGAMIDGDGSQETPPHNDGFNGAGAMIDGDGSQETPPHNDGFNGAGAMIDGGEEILIPPQDGEHGGGGQNNNSTAKDVSPLIVPKGKSPDQKLMDLLAKYDSEKVLKCPINGEIGHNWPLGIIPYMIDPNSHDDIVAARVRKAMDDIESSSCLQFKALKRRPMPLQYKWLHITNPRRERECSHVTSSKTVGEIELVLGMDCLRPRDVLHSLLHGVGLRDEVANPYRDQYVRIMWANIQPKYHKLFMLAPKNNHSMAEFDPMSIMLFEAHFFSSNGQATIVPLISGLQIRPLDELSQLDKQKLHLAFGHECNRRTVNRLYDTCKVVIHQSANQQDNSKENKPSTDANEEVNEINTVPEDNTINEAANEDNNNDEDAEGVVEESEEIVDAEEKII